MAGEVGVFTLAKELKGFFVGEVGFGCLFVGKDLFGIKWFLNLGYFYVGII